MGVLTIVLLLVLLLCGIAALVIGVEQPRRVLQHLALLVSAPLLTARESLPGALDWLRTRINELISDFRQPWQLAGGITSLLLVLSILPGAFLILAATIAGWLGADLTLPVGAFEWAFAVAFFAGLALLAALGLELLGALHLNLAHRLSISARRALGWLTFLTLAAAVYTVWELGELRFALLRSETASDSERWVFICMSLITEIAATLAIWIASHALPLVVAWLLGVAWLALRLFAVIVDILIRGVEYLLGALLALLELLEQLDIPARFEAFRSQRRSQSNPDPLAQAAAGTVPGDAPPPALPPSTPPDMRPANGQFASMNDWTPYTVPPVSPTGHPLNGQANQDELAELVPIDSVNLDPFGMGSASPATNPSRGG